MGLPKAHPRGAYKALLWTFGPFNPLDHDAARQVISRIAFRHYEENLRTIHIAFEVGENDERDVSLDEPGYHHVHVTLEYVSSIRFRMSFLNDLKKLCEIDSAGRKPNCQANYVPHGDKLSAKIGPYQVLLRYITESAKGKILDSGVLEFTPRRPPSRPDNRYGPPLTTEEAFHQELTWVLLPNLKASLTRSACRPVG